jgi:hypothetical protein
MGFNEEYGEFSNKNSGSNHFVKSLRSEQDRLRDIIHQIGLDSFNGKNSIAEALEFLFSSDLSDGEIEEYIESLINQQDEHHETQEETYETKTKKELEEIISILSHLLSSKLLLDKQNSLRIGLLDSIISKIILKLESIIKSNPRLETDVMALVKKNPEILKSNNLSLVTERLSQLGAGVKSGIDNILLALVAKQALAEVLQAGRNQVVVNTKPYVAGVGKNGVNGLVNESIIPASTKSLNNQNKPQVNDIDLKSLKPQDVAKLSAQLIAIASSIINKSIDAIQTVALIVRQGLNDQGLTSQNQQANQQNIVQNQSKNQSENKSENDLSPESLQKKADEFELVDDNENDILEEQSKPNINIFTQTNLRIEKAIEPHGGGCPCCSGQAHKNEFKNENPLVFIVDKEIVEKTTNRNNVQDRIDHRKVEPSLFLQR